MSETMLAAMVTAPGRVELREVPRPKLGPYDALTRTLACSFCRGTDTHLIHGTLPFGPPMPFILGHEGVGEVIATGERCRKFRVGDRVLRAGAAYPAGMEGAPRIGWGGFAEYGLLTDIEALRADDPSARPTAGSAAMQQPIPLEMDANEATVLITLKETLSALRRARFQPGMDVLILGTGPVGLAFAMCARALGARKILAAGRHVGRLDRMRRFGADEGADLTAGEIGPLVKAATGGRGVDLAIDAVGDRGRIGALLATLARGGSVGIYGVPEGSLAEYHHFAFDAKGAPDWWSLTVINPDEPSAHEEALGLVERGKLDLGRFVTHTFSLARIEEALAAVASTDAVKVVVTFPGKGE
ncbi:MAG TPA: zinc-binding dehydrogenase [Armatimonadetes bacterium]|nr:zinc-binding dehydrogenase [Armatimonadota bacterium]